MLDIIIRGGAVVDGTGRPGFRADVAVQGGKIAAVGCLDGEEARLVLDAAGCVVAPGFIDSHAHSDLSFLKDSSYASKLFQGVTTEICGQCGDSPFPALPEKADDNEWQCESFDRYVEKFNENGYSMAVNQAMLVGHGSLRAGVVGMDDRKATAKEMEQMKALLRRDLRAGAWGMSLGLEYSPGFFADADELRQLGEVVAEFDGLIPCHMRSEGLQIDEAIDELLNVGRASGARVHVSHIKLDNFRVHGSAPRVWAKIEAARREGVRVSADQYPFLASCTSLSIRCPKWSHEGGADGLVQALQGPRRQEIVEGIRSHYFNAQRAETCLISDDCGCWPEIVGKNLREIAEEILYTTDYAEAAAEILQRTNGRAGGIFFVMDESDMLYFLRQDVGIGSDGYSLPADAEKVGMKPHPRSYATIPEFFRLTREHGICSLEEAVRRVTSKPADMLGMRDRGRLAVGMAADITVFDPEKFAPRATYLEPVQTAQGVRHVLVNGGVAMQDGVQTEARCGRYLRRKV